MIGFIYIIRSHQTDDVYYGSTTQMLCKRMASHRGNYKLWLNGKYGCNSSFDILKYDDAYIELVEEIEFSNKQELIAREGHHIRENNCVNKNIAGRTPKEWVEDNKEHHIKYQKLYAETHKDIKKIKDKEYRDSNKEKRKLQNKQYYEENREKISEYYKQRYSSKKVSIPEQEV